jgi:hypothetical protein
MSTVRLIAAAAVLVAAASPSARAAESEDTCTGFIAALPAVVAAPGTWCLSKDLGTSIATGIAIKVGTNNVTIDCNGFRASGLGAGASTTTKGIHSDKLNTVVRRCHVRGFRTGIEMSGEDSLVEDNRVEASTLEGIQVVAGGVVRRNIVIDTGLLGDSSAYGIVGQDTAQVVDNRIDGVHSVYSGFGIYFSTANGAVIRDNVLVAIAPSGGGAAWPISFTNGTRALVEGNFVTGPAAGVKPVDCGIGVGPQVVVRDGTTLGYTGWDTDCIDGGGNWPDPP